MSIHNLEKLPRVWIGLGGNVGDVRASMVKAVKMMEKSCEIDVEQASSLYRTPPWGDVDQPDFLNACIRIRTSLEPPALLDFIKDLELKLKRTKTRKWGPRTIDLDILAYDDRRFDSENLQVPHPRILERTFVLKPFAEIDGEFELDGKTVAGWLGELGPEACLEKESGPQWAPIGSRCNSQ